MKRNEWRITGTQNLRINSKYIREQYHREDYNQVVCTHQYDSDHPMTSYADAVLI